MMYGALVRKRDDLVADIERRKKLKRRYRPQLRILVRITMQMIQQELSWLRNVRRRHQRGQRRNANLSGQDVRPVS